LSGFFVHAMKITGIILTGGKSSRMGTDKAVLEFEGQSLLKRAADFCSVFCDEVLISSNNPEHRVEGVSRINDEVKECGPMGGIYSCLKQSSSDWNFVLSVDAPFVQSDFILFLQDHTTDFDAVIPVHEGKKEPLIAFYQKKALPQIETHIKAENYKMHFLLQKLNTHFVDAGAWLEKYPNIFNNLNTPEDLFGTNQ
jgi:molybdenum cofactor guanylyltransferase